MELMNSNGRKGLTLKEAQARLEAFDAIYEVILNDDLCAEAMVAEISDIINRVNAADEKPEA